MATQAVFYQHFALRYREMTARRGCILFMLFCYAAIFASVSSCVKLPRRAEVVRNLTTTAPVSGHHAPINLNTASRADLEKLPGIGQRLAARIVEHRERHGAFRRVEHLIMVRGISERRFDELRAFVTID